MRISLLTPEYPPDLGNRRCTETHIRTFARSDPLSFGPEQIEYRAAAPRDVAGRVAAIHLDHSLDVPACHPSDPRVLESGHMSGEEARRQ
jgi:hypothetical protein